MGIRAGINVVGGWLFAALFAWMLIEGFSEAPKGYFTNHWTALWGGKLYLGYACLDAWRGEFNDPKAVYIWDAVELPTDHQVMVEVRGKNRMGAVVKGAIICATKDGEIDNLATLPLIQEKMLRPDDGEVPP